MAARITRTLSRLKEFELQLSVSFVDWPEITLREQKGKLPYDFCNTGTEEGWIESPPEWIDSSILYQSVYTTWLSMREDFDAESQKHANKSFDMLLGPDFAYELNHPMECWFLAISPTTVASVANHLDSFDFSSMEQLFDKHCSESDLDCIESYDEGFYPYILQWKSAIDIAKEMRWGLLGHCG